VVKLNIVSEHLEELKKRLYKKDESFDARLERPNLAPHLEKPPTQWKEGDLPPVMTAPIKKNRRWIWISLLAVLLAAAGFYFFLFYNSISARRIEIDVTAPESAAGGEKVSWEVLVSNHNKKALESVDFIFEYPQGSEVLDEGVRGLRTKKTLGRIEPGETIRLSFNAFVFGFEGEEKEALTILEYRAQGSNAILSIDGNSKITISRAPVGVSLELPQEARTGQETQIKINYVSNSAGPLKDLILELETPPGFLLQSAEPEQEANGSWALGTLEPGEDGVVLVKGILSGSELEEKSFKATVGLRSSLGEFSVYGQGASTVNLRRPFLEVDAKIAGSDSYSARPGEAFEVEVTYKNNLSVPVQNVVLEGVLSGKLFNEKEIRVTEGTYLSSDKKIVFNSASAQKLSQINPGEGGSFRIELAFIQNIPVKTSADKELKPSIHFDIKAGVPPQGYSGTDLSGEDTIEVKIISRLQLVRKAIHFSSAIQNSGPMPPKVGQETTFTVTWALTNSTNDLRGAVLKATLPAYMSWKSRTLPANSPITFDASSGEIVWNVGDIKAGVGYISPAREISFQVGFVPSSSQVGDSPELVSEVRAEGRDIFTDTLLQVSAPPVTLKLEDDPRVDEGHVRVVN